MINCVSSSAKEPIAMDRNCENSLGDFLEAPSAMLEGMETADLLICEVNPYISDFGKLSVTL